MTLKNVDELRPFNIPSLQSSIHFYTYFELISSKEHKMKFSIFFILAMAVACNAFGQSQDTNSFHILMTKKYVEGEFHGGILYSGSTGEIDLFALGVADPNSRKALNTKHRFAINSLGKMFTAILIMQLVEDGEIELDDSIKKHLPRFEHSRADDITIHHLLSHRSGLPDYFLLQLKGEIPFGLIQNEVLKKIEKMELDFEPDAAFQYSNTGYILLGEIISKYRNGNFQEILTKHIFSILDMNESSITDKSNVTAYFSGDGKIVYYNDDMEIFGDGQGSSSLSDMYKFISAIGSLKLLNPESWELVLTPHSLPSEVPEGAWPPPHQYPYGYGFSLMPIEVGSKVYTMAGHGGAGFGSNYAGRILGTKNTVVVFNNMMKNPILNDVFEYIASQ